MKNKDKRLKILTYFFIIVFTVAIDQLTKYLLYGKSFSLIGYFLWIESPALNTGAAFNMLNNNILLLVITSIFACIMIYLIFFEKRIKSHFIKIATSILLSGTVGNIYDRIVFGGVRDFIYFKSINFAIFNFADIFVNVGVYMIVGYIIYFTFFAKKDIKKYKENDDKKKVISEQQTEKTEQDIK